MAARTIGYLLIVALSGLLLVGWIWHLQPEGDEIADMGPDLIVIERTDAFGSLQRAPVAFRHELHTEALQEDGCKTCHDLDDEGRPIPTFARGEMGWRDLLDTYHEECIGCHTERADSGDKTGPRTCGTCHVPRVAHVSSRLPAGLDLAVHQRHIDAFDEACETCHHVHDEESDELVHVEGEESSCRDCHREVADGDVMSFGDAAHRSCVGCHEVHEGDPVGPTNCSGCHLDGEIDPLTPQPDVARLDRDQPDTTTISLEGAWFLDVEFDHRKHESLAASCRTCHHEKLDKCGTCHTYEGTEEGDFVRLGEAFHEPSSNRSCTGCHVELARRDERCAGCHGDGDLAAGPAQGACEVCHADQAAVLAALQGGATMADLPDPTPDEEQSEDQDSERFWDPPAPPPDDLSAEVEIGHFAERYEVVTFKHADHVEKLMEAGEQLPLATPFHSGKAFTCIACHHTADVNEDNELCTSCHGQRATPDDDLTAPLDAIDAYHRQCVGCHQRMDARTEEGDRPVECADCHAEAAGSAEATP